MQKKVKIFFLTFILFFFFVENIFATDKLGDLKIPYNSNFKHDDTGFFYKDMKVGEIDDISKLLSHICLLLSDNTIECYHQVVLGNGNREEIVTIDKIYGSLETISSSFNLYKDKKYIYSFGSQDIDAIDIDKIYKSVKREGKDFILSDQIDSFEVVGKNYVKDINNVWLATKSTMTKIIPADSKTFKVHQNNQDDTGFATYAYDKNYVYFRGKIIDGADPKSFNVYNLVNGYKFPLFSYDKDNVYFNGRILEGFTPKNFDLGKYLDGELKSNKTIIEKEIVNQSNEILSEEEGIKPFTDNKNKGGKYFGKKVFFVILTISLLTLLLIGLIYRKSSAKKL